MSRCESCAFELWKPYGELSVSSLGLYSDERFPGRSILTLHRHYDELHGVPRELSAGFMEDIQEASELLKKVTGAGRINVAILGNAESHVHAHLIPRYPELEAAPRKSPWDDPRPRKTLDKSSEELLLRNLREAFLPTTLRYNDRNPEER